MAIVKKLLWALVSQDGAVANARTAATALSGQRVEREEVELFLGRLEDRAARRRPTLTVTAVQGQALPR
ncbi:hypothetical protein [Nocardioides caldifontis]|uniref:hypothetical protein n=1 Tax=Nocardioides caldifontis TaxID=2588938 RepID=UPI0011E02885|nr:hypothetical protein [Nocardioides caldifontis]